MYSIELSEANLEIHGESLKIHYIANSIQSFISCKVSLNSEPFSEFRVSFEEFF